ncbi:MAG: flagellar biosynthesis regulator FlaF [Rhodospirillum sp.]|nr:flagellar biosynthesis regulator FlaF [Rhodospirillum sp.]MCF8490533.1 flagellar biosynthesis regulator FlaF [Rhodospirillum sp.]MCF8502143.1 flagellar biosynthesis regulator FlaF [Rhodospirillum sp.]
MAKDQIRAYQQNQKANLTPREVEAMAFTKAAVMMEDARNKEGDKEALSQALRFNHLLWTIIQADITEPSNSLPPELKANIMSLSLFVDKQTTSILRSRDASEVEILITINRNLASGLRANPGDPVAGA